MMVGHENEPGSDVALQNVDYNLDVKVGESEEEVEKVFRNSKYFGEHDGSFRAAGIRANISQDSEGNTVIEYCSDQPVQDPIAREFVNGILRSFSDVKEEFLPQVENKIYEEGREVRTDGGFNVGDNYEVSDIPIGGGPNRRETDTYKAQGEDADPDGVIGM